MTLTRSEWMKEVWARPGHKEKMARALNTPELKKRQSERVKKQWTPERRKRHSQRMKELWASPEYQEKMKKMWADPESKEKRSKVSKKMWADPEHQTKISQKRKEMWADPEFREKRAKAIQEPEYKEKHAKAMKKMRERPEYIKNHARGMKRLWADPEYRELQAKINNSPERKKKRINYMKSRWNDLEYRENMSGETAPNWQGGLSFEPYPPGFNDYLKMKIKERDGWKCILCPSRENLAVHHINYLKADLHEENLITLCNSCHSKTNHNRDYWEAFLTTLTEQKEPLQIPLMKPLSQDPTYSLIGGINDGY